MTSFRFVPCPVCHGSGVFTKQTFLGTVSRGCRVCAEDALTIGTGRIGVTFEHSPEVTAALRAHSGKEK